MMVFDLIPKAIAWVQEQQVEILSSGYTLSDEQIEIAHEVGVTSPENIRIKLVKQIPLPNDPELAKAAIQSGLFGPEMKGMTFFYGIYICQGAVNNNNLIAHEFRHVYQYELRGSISAFLKEYLQQIFTVGYTNAPLEQDANQAAFAYI